MGSVGERVVRTGCWRPETRKRLVAACGSWTARGIRRGSQAPRARCSADSHHGFALGRAEILTEVGRRREVAACHGGRMHNHLATPRCLMTRQKERDVRLHACVGWSDVCAMNGAVVVLLLVPLLFEKSVVETVAAVVSGIRYAWMKYVALGMLSRTALCRLLRLLRGTLRLHSSSRSQSSQNSFGHLHCRRSDWT